MRLKTWDWSHAELGERRTKTWFAWFPVWIDNDLRWLETVRVVFEYSKANAFLPPCAPYKKWVKRYFLDL